MNERQTVIEALKFCEREDFDCEACPGWEISKDAAWGCAIFRKARLMLEENDRFHRWLAHVVTTDGSDAANMEFICRKLAKMGYIDVGDGGEWREAQQDVELSGSDAAVE